MLTHHLHFADELLHVQNGQQDVRGAVLGLLVGAILEAMFGFKHERRYIKPSDWIYCVTGGRHNRVPNLYRGAGAENIGLVILGVLLYVRLSVCRVLVCSAQVDARGEDISLIESTVI